MQRRAACAAAMVAKQQRTAALIMLSLAALLTAPNAALAHAVLLEASPADGEVVTRAPAELVLRFNENVTPVFVHLLDAAGHPIATQDAHGEDQTVRLALPPDLANGSYVVSYRVISADTHPVGESLLFAVGPPGTVIGAASLDETLDKIWRGLALGDRALLDMGFLVAVGGGLFVLLVRGALAVPAARRVILAGAVVAALAAIFGLGIEGGFGAEAPLAALGRIALWRSGIATALGPSVALMLLGLAVLAIGTLRERRVVIAVGAVLTALSYAVTGHIATAAPRWLTAPALWLHVLCVAFWVGSLVPLLLLLRRDGAGAAPTVERFGRSAIAVVALLAAAGVTMVAVQVPHLSDFLGTEYGIRLLWKLGLVATLLAVAAVNRLWLTPALRRREPRAAQRLGHMIVVELAGMALIVVTTARLGQATPPRALAEQAQAHHARAAAEPPGFFVEIADVGISAFVAVEPAKPGLNRLRLDLADGHDAPLAALGLKLSIANPQLGIEPRERELVPNGAGSYEIADLAFPASGTWTLSIDALVSDFEKRVVTTEIPIR